MNEFPRVSNTLAYMCCKKNVILLDVIQMDISGSKFSHGIKVHETGETEASRRQLSLRPRPVFTHSSEPEAEFGD